MKYTEQTPLPHQARIIKENKPRILCDWECRVGKTIPACHWVDNLAQVGNTFIICNKSNKKSWQSMGTRATVYTKEEFKKYAHTIKYPTAIVVDEVHRFGAPLFVKPRSELATTLYNLLRESPNCHFMGLSGSMVRNSPWSFHTLMCYLGVYYDWKKYREEMFELKKMPYLRFPAYFAKADWRERVDRYRKKYCDQVSLSEVVDVLPPATSRIITVKQPKYVVPEDEIVTWVDEHHWEQNGKINEILDLEYKKIILVCKYTKQIDFLAEKLREEKLVFILDGRTKNQEETIRMAQETKECYLICQSSMGEGFDGWMFGVLVFISMGHSHTEYIQMSKRLLHPKHLKPTETIFLLGGRWDKRIYDSIMLGEDFNPHKYI